MNPRRSPRSATWLLTTELRCGDPRACTARGSGGRCSDSPWRTRHRRSGLRWRASPVPGTSRLSSPAGWGLLRGASRWRRMTIARRTTPMTAPGTTAPGSSRRYPRRPRRVWTTRHPDRPRNLCAPPWVRSRAGSRPRPLSPRRPARIGGFGGSHTQARRRADRGVDLARPDHQGGGGRLRQVPARGEDRRGGDGGGLAGRNVPLERTGLKLVRPEYAQNDKGWKRFQREARLMAKLTHPNAVAIYDFRRSQSMGYIEMEFVRAAAWRSSSRTTPTSRCLWNGRCSCWTSSVPCSRWPTGT